MLTYSIGDLIDKLCVLHNKVFHLEQAIEIAAENNRPAEEIEKLLDQIVSLNNLRVKIVDSINEFFEALNEHE